MSLSELSCENIYRVCVLDDLAIGEGVKRFFLSFSMQLLNKGFHMNFGMLRLPLPSLPNLLMLCYMQFFNCLSPSLYAAI